MQIYFRLLSWHVVKQTWDHQREISEVNIELTEGDADLKANRGMNFNSCENLCSILEMVL